MEFGFYTQFSDFVFIFQTVLLKHPKHSQKNDNNWYGKAYLKLKVSIATRGRSEFFKYLEATKYELLHHINILYIPKLSKLQTV